MEYLIIGLVLAVLVAPFIWPAFAIVYRYFHDLEDDRYARKHDPSSPG